ncbi:hypothetical protein [Arthrobacter mobilis]|uniref:Uncharacterized protein n=1 Tax=Arthrobacter mobilis TaxID=2724944 RepID=A0A7X6HEQ0_9MICC|nr:hypothetical protein [Arthrobacter mobilis]NKX54621.1 hypothetical protein [Arthrobacter mobilis]
MVAALGLALTNWLVPRFTQVINSLTETGDPVTVQVIGQEVNVSVVLPPRSRLTHSDLAELGSISPEDQLKLLSERGAVRDAPEYLSLELTGNRSEQVRIVNIEPITSCSSPAHSTRVNLASGFGHVDTSTAMHFDLDRSPATAMFIDDERTVPYFPARTIRLAQDEQIVVLALVSARERLCDFELELTVLSGGEEHTQRINDDGRPFVRIASQADSYEHVYWGGTVCKDYVEYKGPWTSQIQVCGEDNTRP